MISGVAVKVLFPVPGGTDRFNEPVADGFEELEVRGVLVAPGATDGLEAARPDGVRASYTLHFPKGFAASLRGCSVELPEPWAGRYRVVGDPRPLMDANTPTPWHMPVEVEAVDG